MYIACHVCKKKSLVIMLTVLVATIQNLVVCSPQFVAEFKGSSNLWFDSEHVCVCASACACVY